MKKEDVVTLTQKALAEVMGTTYMEQIGDLSALESSKLIDVGTAVENAGRADQYTKSLITLLADLEVTSNEFDRRIRSLFVESYDWGGYKERAYVGQSTIIEDPMYNLVNGQDYSEYEHKFYAPAVITKIFEEGKAVMTPISIQAEGLRESFRSWDSVNEFLSAIRTAVRSTMNVALYTYQHMLLACGIALSASPNGLNNAVHLLTEAKALGLIGSTATVDDFKKSPECLRYAIRRMFDIEGQMRELSAAYNNHEMPIFATETGKVMLSQFKNLVKTSVLVDAFNQDELDISDFESVAYWQGVMTSEDDTAEYFAWNTVSSISLSSDANNKLGIGTGAFDQSNIIAVVFDRRAMGMTLNRRKITSQYTASADFWNEFLHQLVNYIIDTTFGIVAFIID